MPTLSTPPKQGPALDYAPPPPLLRRRTFRLGVLLLLLGGLALAGAFWGKEGWRRVRVAWWQRQCLHYAAPPDLVVYDQDPATAPALAARGGGYSSATLQGTPRTGYEPPCLAALCNATGSVPPTGPGHGVLFLHERQTPAGVRRLVLVRCDNFADIPRPMFINGFDVDARTLEPGTWGGDLTDRTPGMSIDIMSAMVVGAPRLRVFAGQPDPADPAHFTINYELDGKSHTVDGWLRDSGEVEFKTRPSSED